MREAVIVSTCNRMEIYGAFSDADEAQRSVRELLMAALVAGGPLPEAEDPEMLCAPAPVRPRAAGGGAAPVPGGGQPGFAGDRRAADPGADQGGLRAGAAGGDGRAAAGRRVPARRSGWRARSGGTRASPLAKVSVSSVAVDLARQVWGGFEGRRVLIVGAGKMADLAARVLVREGATLAIINRTQAQAPRSWPRAWAGRRCPGTTLARGAGARGHRLSPRPAPASPCLPTTLVPTTPAGPGTEPSAAADRHRGPPQHRARGADRWTASSCGHRRPQRSSPTTRRTAGRRPTGPRR